jgi:hypothetical protein
MKKSVSVFDAFLKVTSQRTVLVKCQKCDSTQHLALFHFDQQKKPEKEDHKEVTLEHI